MREADTQDASTADLTPEKILAQLELMRLDEVFRSSKFRWLSRSRRPAWELSQQTQDNELLEVAYGACSRWDAWLLRYHDRRHTGLCEGFCTYDTGHDNSPRWAGIPNRCPDGDARICPPVPSLPRLCPDLSATVYGGRVALAAMAQALGRKSEADHWLELADAIRSAILHRLYDPAAAFYDIDAQNLETRGCSQDWRSVGMERSW